jgi:hypothetical protein
MHKHQETTKHERKARQTASEEALREKNAKNALARLAQEQAVTVACTVLEGVLEKEARAEKGEGYRTALVAKNPVIECRIVEMLHDNEGVPISENLVRRVRVPFAALPMQCQRAAVVEYMKLNA